jgi:HEPN domain-containing protein
MEIAHARALIERELETGEAALRAGNDGKARVCARSAAGTAISYWLEYHGERHWGTDAMSQLAHLRQESAVPSEVREAALRLTTKITEQFTSPFSTNPLDDCRIITGYCLRGS